MDWGSVADWFVGIATLILAAVAVWQEDIRARWHYPELSVTTETAPPDCAAVPFMDVRGTLLSDSVYLRIWVKNVGTATANKVEVYADQLRVRKLDRGWDEVAEFPSMNLKWSNVGKMYFPRIHPGMGKFCDVAHIADPARRHMIREDAPRLNLDPSNQTSLAFDLIAAPNNRNHIVGPGEYELDILVAADNFRPGKHTITLSLTGQWDADEAKMLSQHVGIAVRSAI